MDYNTNNNSSNMNYHKLIPVSIEEARNWYKGDDNILKTLALRAFSEKELGHSFRDIKSFEDACNALGLDYDDLDSVIANMIIFGHSRASAAIFQLNIIRKALNLDYELNLTKDPKDSCIYHPLNLLTTGKHTYPDKMEIIGKIEVEGKDYLVLSGSSDCTATTGIGCYYPRDEIGFAYSDVAFFGCATKEIAEHFGRYFGMLITMAKYGDLPDFHIISSKYN